MSRTLPFPPPEPPSTPPADPLAGTPYRTIAPLGRGAVGEVVEAEHIALAKRVVVKLLHPSHAARADVVDRLRLEGQALARLSHPNIVAVTDLQVTPSGRHYLVMERLVGRTLGDELRARGALPIPQAVDITRQILAGLEAAHDLGIVHRDIKPENIFLCDADPGASRPVKILDFGMAKVAAPGAVTQGLLDIRTGEGIALGTPRFFSPEQAAFKPVDARADIYAVGALLYTMLAGRSPFEHLTTAAELLRAHISITPPPPSAFAPQHIALDLEAAILVALAKRPQDRFASASLFAEALALTQLKKGRWARTDPLAPFASAAAPVTYATPPRAPHDSSPRALHDSSPHAVPPLQPARSTAWSSSYPPHAPLDDATDGRDSDDTITLARRSDDDDEITLVRPSEDTIILSRRIGAVVDTTDEDDDDLTDARPTWFGTIAAAAAASDDDDTTLARTSGDRFSIESGRPATLPPDPASWPFVR